MQGRLNEVHHRLVWRFSARAADLVARLLFLSAPHVDKDHQHARFDNLWINRQRLAKSHFRPFEVFAPPRPLKTRFT